MRSLISFAAFCLVSATAHALVYAPADTPERDLYDGQTKLQWIKAESLEQGQAEGYRLATVAETRDLISKTLQPNQSWTGAVGTLYVGSPRSLFFDIGWDVPVARQNHFEGISIGYVDSGNGTTTLAGMMSIVTQNGGGSRYWSTGRYSGWLIGSQQDFLDNRFDLDPKWPLSTWTDAWMYSPYTDNSVVLTSPDWFDDQGNFATGYFMVKTNLALSPIPELHNMALMTLGLLVLPYAMRRGKRG